MCKVMEAFHVIKSCLFHFRIDFEVLDGIQRYSTVFDSIRRYSTGVLVHETFRLTFRPRFYVSRNSIIMQVENKHLRAFGTDICTEFRCGSRSGSHLSWRDDICNFWPESEEMLVLFILDMLYFQGRAFWKKFLAISKGPGPGPTGLARGAGLGPGPGPARTP